jgi:hypothetical protein
VVVLRFCSILVLVLSFPFSSLCFSLVLSRRVLSCLVHSCDRICLLVCLLVCLLIVLWLSSDGLVISLSYLALSSLVHLHDLLLRLSCLVIAF